MYDINVTTRSIATPPNDIIKHAPLLHAIPTFLVSRLRDLPYHNLSCLSNHFVIVLALPIRYGSVNDIIFYFSWDIVRNLWQSRSLQHFWSRETGGSSLESIKAVPKTCSQLELISLGEKDLSCWIISFRIYCFSDASNLRVAKVKLITFQCRGKSTQCK